MSSAALTNMSAISVSFNDTSACSAQMTGDRTTAMAVNASSTSSFSGVNAKALRAQNQAVCSICKSSFTSPVFLYLQKFLSFDQRDGLSLNYSITKICDHVICQACAGKLDKRSVHKCKIDEILFNYVSSLDLNGKTISEKSIFSASFKEAQRKPSYRERSHSSI